MNGSSVPIINGHQSNPIQELDASLLTKTLTKTLRPVPEDDSPELWSFSACSDHMVTAKWTVNKGWEAPELKPYGDLSINPAASCLHYATQCFEGMKAYRGHDGKLRLFRPDRNAARMVTSAARVSLPTFDPNELVKLIKELLAVDGARWLSKPGSFIYIRPTLIGNGPQMGVQVPQEALLYVILAPWPDFCQWKNRTTPMGTGLNLLASHPSTIRAWPGGFGHHKVGANYGPSFKAHVNCLSEGHDQILWLFGPESIVTEAGASNFFVIWRNKETGRKELVTATTDDEVFLPGVIRKSVLELCRERFGKGKKGESDLDYDLDIIERRFLIKEVEDASKEGRLIESFVSGTAYFITPVTKIQLNAENENKNENTKITFPPIPEGSASYTMVVKKWLEGIMYGSGEPEHPWGVVVDEKPLPVTN